MNVNEIKEQVRLYLAEHVFSGKLPHDFTNETPLVSTKLVNSITILHLVNHFEESLKIEFEAHEMSVEYINTVNLIANFMFEKINAQRK